MTTAPTSEASSTDEPSPLAPRGLTSVGLGWHALALGLVLMVALAVTQPHAIAVPDEGVYLAQADALAGGTWRVDRVAPLLDPEGEYSRLLPETVIGDQAVPYARHAAYPLLLTPAYLLGGQAGTVALSVLGLWLTATLGALIARRIDRRLAIPTLWLVGVGSPLSFYGFVTMAHTLGAAAGAAGFLGLSVWLEDRRKLGLLAGSISLVALVLLRSEGTILALAMAASIGLAALERGRSQDPGRVDVRALATSLFCGCLVVAAYIADSALGASLAGTGRALNPAAIATRASADPLSGAWASLLRPGSSGSSEGAVWVGLAALALVAASLTLRFAPRRVGASLGLLGLAAAGAVLVLLDPPLLVTGLLGACPLLLAGWVWLRREDLSDPLVRRAVLVCVLAGAGIVMTIYRNGGAAEWGGRFFAVMLGLLVPLAVLGLLRASEALRGRARASAAMCVVLVTLALSLSAVRTQVSLREEFTDLVVGTRDFMAQRGDSATPVVFANRTAGGSSRAFWEPDPMVPMLSVGSVENLVPLLEAGSDAGIDEMVVLTDLDTEEVPEVLAPLLERAQWTAVSVHSTPQDHARLVVVRA